MKTPSEAINIALAETLQCGMDEEDVSRKCTLVNALYYAALPDVTSEVIEELIKGFGASVTEFPGVETRGIYHPDDWSPGTDYYENGEFYHGFQINKAFMLMMMEEWFAANPAEDSWEAVAEWKAEMEKKMEKKMEMEMEAKKTNPIKENGK